MKKSVLLMVAILCGFAMSAQDTKTEETTKVVKEKVEEVVKDGEEKTITKESTEEVEKVVVEPVNDAEVIENAREEEAIKERAKGEDPVEEVIEEEDDDQ